MVIQEGQFLDAALCIDAENHADLDLEDLMRQLPHLNIVERHAHGDWRHPRLDLLAQKLGAAGFDMHHVWTGDRPGMRKNKADDHMARGIEQVVTRYGGIPVVVIVSGDGHFVNITRELQGQGRRVIVVADPLRVSQELRTTADQYLPIGRLAHWIRALSRLERTTDYLTFSFAQKQLRIGADRLSDMINKRMVIQERVRHPQRGHRSEIRLNKGAALVRIVLDAVADWEEGLGQTVV